MNLHKLEDIEAKLSPESRTRVQAMVRKESARMMLAEFRRLTGTSQAALAKALGVSQPNISQLESQDDMQLSVLRNIVHTLGGSLSLVVTLPGKGEFILQPFSQNYSPPKPAPAKAPRPKSQANKSAKSRRSRAA